MPTYEVTSPDGKTYEVTAPEGASHEQVMDYVKSHHDAPKERSFGEGLARQAGLTGRYLVEGAAYLPAAAANTLAYTYNKGADLIQGEGRGMRFPDQNQNISQALTKAGFPEPETGLERVVGDASRAVAGAGAFTGAGRALTSSVEPVTKAVGKSLASAPGYQAAGAAVSGGAAGGAHEGKLGALAETAAAGTGLLVPSGSGPAKSAAQIMSRLRGSPMSEEEASNIALEYLVKTLERDGVTPAVVGERLASAGGKPMVIADVGGENTTAALRTATQSPGPARNMTKEFLTERQAGQRERIASDADSVFGSRDAGKLEYATKTKRAAAADEDFQAAFGRGVIRSKPLSSLFQAPAMKDAIGYAQQIAGNEYAVARADKRLGAADTEDWAKAVADLPNKTAFPAKYLHYLKMGLDAKLESLRDPITGRINYSDPSVRAADNVRKRFRAEVKNLNPMYADALDHFSSESALLTAQRDGASALKLKPEQIATMRTRLSPEEQSRFRVGFGKALQDMIEQSGDGTNAAARIAGNTLMRKRIASVLGDRKSTEAFLRNITGEQRMFETRAAQGGSMTTPRALDEIDFQGASLADTLEKLAKSRSLGSAAVHWAWDHAVKKYETIWQGLTEQVKHELAKMLISTDPKMQQAAIRRLESLNATKNALAVRNPKIGSVNAIAAQFSAQQP